MLPGQPTPMSPNARRTASCLQRSARAHRAVADAGLCRPGRARCRGGVAGDMGRAARGAGAATSRPRPIWASCWRSKPRVRSRASIWWCRRSAAQVLASGVTTPAEFAAALDTQATVRTLADRLAQPAAGGRDHRGKCGWACRWPRPEGCCRRRSMCRTGISSAGFATTRKTSRFIGRTGVQAGWLQGWTAYVVRRVAGPDGQTLGFVAGGAGAVVFRGVLSRHRA